MHIHTHHTQFSQYIHGKIKINSHMWRVRIMYNTIFFRKTGIDLDKSLSMVKFIILEIHHAKIIYMHKF